MFSVIVNKNYKPRVYTLYISGNVESIKYSQFSLLLISSTPFLHDKVLPPSGIFFALNNQKDLMKAKKT